MKKLNLTSNAIKTCVIVIIIILCMSGSYLKTFASTTITKTDNSTDNNVSIKPNDVTTHLDYENYLFASFFRRLETYIYGSFRMPCEIKQGKISSTVPVKIKFNKKGEILDFELIEPSGHKELDDSIKICLNTLKPIGALPKKYSGNQLNLVLFFIFQDGRLRLK